MGVGIWDYNKLMEKDRLKKYETETSAVPRQSVKGLSQLPKQKGSGIRVLLGTLGIALALAVLWLVIK